MTAPVDRAILRLTGWAHPGGGVGINEIFKALDEAKQRRIINAAFDEFALHGYEKASTNRITQNAGISKGMLFYYFNSKKELYHDLVACGIALIQDEYLSQIGESSDDFIERYRQASVVKMKALAENPQAFHFFASLYLHKDHAHLPKEAAKQMESIREEGFAKIYDHLNTAYFRPDIPGEKIIRMIQWCMEGYERKLIERLKEVPAPNFDDQPYWDEFYAFLDDLRAIFYCSESQMEG